jgi:hypothetical protein
MKRNGGFIAGMLVVMTYLGVSNLPKSPEGTGGPAPKTVNAQSSQASGLNSNAYRACKEIGDRLERILKKSNAPTTDTWKFIKPCYFDGNAAATGSAEAWPDIQFAIATVPNPVSTHLPLAFDRVVESIQQAAQDDQFTYDSAYFPWEDTKKEYAYFNDQEQSERMRKAQVEQPGVMVFRGPVAVEVECRNEDGKPSSHEWVGLLPYHHGLVVFLVGEQPTGGIDDAQFENSLLWIQQLTKGRVNYPLRILGPMFSGSFPSLRENLEQALDAPTKPGDPEWPRGTKIRVASGTVSSSEDSGWFRDWIQNKDNKTVGAGSEFWTVTDDDSDMVSRFCAYLQGQGYHGVVASLNEDETAYGYGGDELNKGCPASLSWYYPRDIATLRSAYESQSVFSSSKPTTSSNAPATMLRGDLSEPASSDHDTVRSYSNQLTPLAQEAILLDIARQLKEANAQFIILKSTNSLDQIFLTEFLHRAYPEGRVVISGSDLLFGRGAESRLMRGAMSLSAYPLFDPFGPAATTGLNKSRIFAEDFSAGEYLAAHDLFQDPPVHSPPPAPWISVVSHGQFWPLAALMKDPEKPEAGEEAPRKFRIPSVMWIFLIACVLWAGLHAAFCWTGNIMGSPRARAYFAPIPGWQHPALIATGSFLIAALAVVIAASCGLFWWINTAGFPYGVWNGIFLGLCVSAILVAALAGCVGNFASKARFWRRWQRPAAWSAFACLAATLAIYLYLVSKLKSGNAFPLYWRNVNPTSGVAALLSEVLLIAGMYLWFWCNLRGLAHFGSDRPKLPLDKDLPKIPPGLGDTSWMPMFSQDKAGNEIEKRARPLGKGYLIRLVVAFLATLGLSALALQGISIRTLGELAFGKLIFFWVCLSIGIILADGIEMWIAWNELRQLLIFLDRLPLRRTLRALRGLAWGSVWKLSGNVLEERYRAITFQFESCTHLTNVVETFEAGMDLGPVRRAALRKELNRFVQIRTVFAAWFVTVCRYKSVENIDPLIAFQHAQAFTAGVVIANVLLPAWQKEKESLIVERSGSETKSGEVGAKELVIPVEHLPAHIRAAEEFVVLPYLAFIQNILGRIRTIGLGSLWLFLGTTLALSSYPFDPLNILGLIFLAVFVLYGGVAVVVYSQISRDATLSHITDTNPGELGWEFWQRVGAFGVAPLIGLLTTLFPSISEFVFSWIQPSAQALK